MDYSQPVRFLALALLLSLTVACARPAEAAVERLQGRLQVMDAQTWIVGDQLVMLTRETSVNGRPAVGAVVELSGVRNETGVLVARQLEVVESPRPTPSPTNTAEPSPAVVPAREPEVEQDDHEDEKKDLKREREKKEKTPKTPKSPKT